MGYRQSASPAERLAGPTRHLFLANCGHDRPGVFEAVSEELDREALAPEHVEVRQTCAFVTFPSPEVAATVAERFRGRRVSEFGDPHPTAAIAVKFVQADAKPKGPVAHVPHPVEDVGVPGFTLVRDAVSEAEEAALLAAIDATPWETSIKRRVQHYGFAFSYTGLGVDANRDDLVGMPPFVSGLPLPPGFAPEQLTINEYLPGVGIAMHVDTHSAFGDEIVVVSLGAGIALELRRGDDTRCQWIPPRSLYVMAGEARYGWEHGVASRQTDGDRGRRSRRVSLTFRTLRPRGEPCSCAYPELCDDAGNGHAQPSRLSST